MKRSAFVCVPRGRGRAALGAQSVRVRVALGLCYAGYREETYSTILQRLDATRWSVELDLAAGSSATKAPA